MGCHFRIALIKEAILRLRARALYMLARQTLHFTVTISFILLFFNVASL